MFRRLLLPLLLVAPASRASADPAVRDLAIRTLKEKPNKHVSVEYFHVVAPTLKLTAAINDAIDADAGVASARTARGASIDTTCSPGLATTRVVSWSCNTSGASLDGSGGSSDVTSYHCLLLDGDRVREATLDDLFVGLDPRSGAHWHNAAPGPPSDPDVLPPNAELRGIFLDDQGMTLLAEVASDPSDFYNRTFTWQELIGHLPPGDPYGISRRRPAAAAAQQAARFAKTDKGTVVDPAHGLEWADADNGADVDLAGAHAYASAYRGGGHSDWRLPTLEEVKTLVDTAATHKIPGSCDGGGHGFAITPLIHLSCGLVWSEGGSRPFAAMGFISGSPRVPRREERKNLRALPVRAAVPAP